MEEKELFGNLFNSIPLQNEEHLDTILNTMDNETALFFIVQSVKHAFHQGVFSLGECEVLSKCIRIISKSDKK